MGGILSEIEHGTPYRQPVFALLREDPQIATCRPVALSITLVDHLIGEADHGGVASNIDLEIMFPEFVNRSVLAEVDEPKPQRRSRGV